MYQQYVCHDLFLNNINACNHIRYQWFLNKWQILSFQRDSFLFLLTAALLDFMKIVSLTNTLNLFYSFCDERYQFHKGVWLIGVMMSIV